MRNSKISNTSGKGNRQKQSGKTLSKHGTAKGPKRQQTRLRARRIIYESEKFSAIFDQAADALFIHDFNGRFVDVNEKACESLGYTKKELLNMSVFDIERNFNLPQAQREWKKIKPNKYFTLFGNHRKKSGEIFPVEVRFGVFYHNGKKHIFGLIKDITTQKRNEEELEKSRRTHEFISRINKMIVLESEEQNIYENTCSIAVKYGKYRMAWIGLLDDNTNNVIPVFKAGMERNYLKRIRKITINKSPEENGPTAMAIRNGKYFVCNDIENDPVMKPWKVEAMKRGYYSSIALPLKLQKKVIGTLNLYSGNRNYFDRKEIKLLTEVADNISFVLKAIHTGNERKKTEAELIKNENRLRFALEGTNDGLWDVNMKTGEVYLSPRGCEILGYKPDELNEVAKKWNDLVNPDDLAYTNLRLDSYLKGRAEIFEVEQRLRTKSGEWKWILARGKVVERDSRGEPLRMTGTHTDISSKKAEEELRLDTQEKYFSLFENSFDAILLTSPDGKILSANPEACRMFQRTQEEICELGRTGITDMTDDRIPPLLEKRRKFGYARGELTFIRKDGTKFEGEITSAVFKDSKGNEKSSMIIRDITERKSSEDAIRKSESQLNFALKQSMTGGWELNLRNHKASRTLEHDRIFGYEKLLSEWTYEMFLGHVIPEDKERVNESFQNAIANKADWNFECRIKRCDGIERWIWAAGGHLPDAYGKSNLMAGIVQDITDRKKNEEELRMFRDQLEQLNIHLNNIREEERAAISREIHDELGQSLTALKMDLSYLIERTKESEDIQKKLTGMTREISETIKNVQRISSELRPGILDDLGLTPAVEWYCEEFEKRTGILCKLTADETETGSKQKDLALFRMMQESLTNVIRHSGANIVKIILRNESRTVRLVVEDNGKGFDVNNISFIKSLGLFGMKERVKQFNGEIIIESEINKGTKVQIDIPVNQTEL